VRSRIQTGGIQPETSEFREDVRRIFQELEQTSGEPGLTGAYTPALDIFDSDSTVEVVLDLPGVAPASVRVVARGQTVLVAGEKAPRRVRGESSFHLVERGYGRFARAIRLASPCDASRATAVLTGGELRISIPKVDDRRGRSIPIAVTSA
jgi:HSP20 family protein